jgi:hypothetical protein
VNRETRDLFASGTDQSLLPTQQIDLFDGEPGDPQGNFAWQTAPRVYEKIADDFGPFDVDLTADRLRALLPVWFGPDSPTQEYDALEATWARPWRQSGFSNPPYGRFIASILAKARRESECGFESTFLIPMRVTAAFRKHILGAASELLFCDKRLVFFENGAPRINPKTGKPDGALFDSVIVRFRPGRTLLHVGEWKVPPHAPGQRGYRA